MPVQVPGTSYSVLGVALMRSLGSRFLGVLAGVHGVGEADDAEQDHEQRDGAEDQAAEAGRLVTGLGGAHATRPVFMTSCFLICFIASRPPVILPNTVWTPFR